MLSWEILKPSISKDFKDFKSFKTPLSISLKTLNIQLVVHVRI